MSDVRAGMGAGRSGPVVLVRCGARGTKAVRGVWTGVTVPDLVGEQVHSWNELGAASDLHYDVSCRHTAGTEDNTTVLRQHPTGGRVVPTGSTVKVVVAC